MTSNLSINNLRLSFLWVETFPNLLKDAASSQAPFAFVGNSDSYKTEFKKAQAETSQYVQLPWKLELKRPTNYFWIYYLMDKDDKGPVELIDVDGKRAWKQLVPLCSHNHLPRVKAPWLEKKGYVCLEAFYYPHRLALLVTIGCLKQLTPNQVVETAFQIKYNDKFQVQWNTATSELDLNTLADTCLNTLRKENLGLDKFPEGGIRSRSPFTVLTVVQGEIKPEYEIPENGEIHSMLEQVTVWRRIKTSPGVTLATPNVVNFFRKGRCRRHKWRSQCHPHIICRQIHKNLFHSCFKRY